MLCSVARPGPTDQVPTDAPTLGKAGMDRLSTAVLAPVRAFRLAFLPLLMVYFAYGALGVTAVADSFWVKKELTLKPDDLAGLGVWLTLPWTIKMVFGELVDTVPLLGSQRRIYVFLGAGLVATGLLLLAGAAGKWITFARPEVIYVVAQLLTVNGVVLQDVVADAMSTEVVARGATRTARLGTKPTSTEISAWSRCSAAWRCRWGFLLSLDSPGG
jgi:hypothetical protein